MEREIDFCKSCVNCAYLGIRPNTKKRKKFFCKRNTKIRFPSLCYYWELNYEIASESELEDENMRIKEWIFREYGGFGQPSFEQVMAKIEAGRNKKPLS